MVDQRSVSDVATAFQTGRCRDFEFPTWCEGKTPDQSVRCKMNNQRKIVLSVLAALELGALVAVGQAPDILVQDFEGNDYGTWTVAGNAFGKGPAQGTLPNQMPVSGFQGNGLINSFSGGDD